MHKGICNTYTSNGREGDIPCENCGHGPDAHERKAKFNAYPERFEIQAYPTGTKIVFAKNSNAFHGYDCWLETKRSTKPRFGRAATYNEFVLLEYIFARQDVVVDSLRKQRADAIANRQRYKEMNAQLVEAFCDGQQAGLRHALFMLVPDGPENDEVMAERKEIADKNRGSEPY